MEKKSAVASTFTLFRKLSRAGYEQSKFMDDPKWQLFAKTKVKVYYSAKVDVCQRRK
jgi:hypothetical protein